jgi:hypothetical protein
MPSVRRLTAILAADVAGYSRLMGADEEGTHERLRGHLRDLIEPKIAEHRGRIVKNTGDGFLAEFASVVDAVRCATEIQRGMIDREPQIPDERRVRFRIGVNLGDVIAEEHDIVGDGVNVAARLACQAFTSALGPYLLKASDLPQGKALDELTRGEQAALRSQPRLVADWSACTGAEPLPARHHAQPAAAVPLEAKAASLHAILGSPDDIKFRSCATLFAVEAGERENPFQRALDRSCDGQQDERTLALLRGAR